MKTITKLLIIAIGLSTAAYGQKKAGTAIPSMGEAYLKKEKQNPKLSPTELKNSSIIKESYSKKVPGTYYTSTKTATVITDTGKTYTIESADEKYEGGPISYSTTSKDTLFLQDSRIGNMIKEIWDIDKKYAGKRPVILMVPSVATVMAARQPKSITDKKKVLKN